MAVNTPIKKLHLERLPRETQRALEVLKDLLPQPKKWYLAGGTALTLQVGHRRSVDLDFFTTDRDFDRQLLERQLMRLPGKWKTTFQEAGTVYGELFGAKVSFIANPSFVPSKIRIPYGKVRMLTPLDIAVMKVIALSQRGRKRDFFDVYWYCQVDSKKELEDLLRRSLIQYPAQKGNFIHLVKSLVYFEDAEKDPLPQIFFKADWAKVKEYFRTQAKKISRSL
jgi:hypothetical protein